jgi:ubiquinone/menaquinone biosynthesis C-methylase UbiE
MRLDVAGDGLLEKIGLGLGLVPKPLIHTTFGVGYARSIVAATRLGVFRAIGHDRKTPAEIAEATSCSTEGMRALCAALVGFKMLTRKDGRYANSADVKKFLLPDSKMPLEDAVLFLGECHNLVWNLEDDVRSGDIVRIHDRQHPESFWKAYMGALSSFAKLIGPEIMRKVKTSNPKRLLDVGGGHGRYAAAMCRKHEGLTADVLDLAPACIQGRRIQAEDGTDDRVSHIEGDFRTCDWGTGYDLIFILNVTHNATEPEVQGLLAKAYGALNEGGSLVIMDAVHNGDDGKLDASAGWNELFFFVISGAQAWPEPRIRGWMEDAGFGSLRRSQLLAAPQFVLQGTR